MLAAVMVYNPPMLIRPPCARLRPFVKLLWAGRTPAGGRERVLPTGGAHLVFRVDGPPLRLFASEADAEGVTIGHAIVGGPRDQAYLRDVSTETASVGAQLWPGALALILGMPAEELAGRHAALPWRDAARVQERLAGLREAERLDGLEAELLRRLPAGLDVDPAVAAALRALEAGADIAQIVAASGFSHRHFIARFVHHVGLTPKRFQRVLRFQAGLTAIRSEASLADAAYAAGFSDQAQLSREVRRITGLSPRELRGAARANANHVPLGSNFDKTPGANKGRVAR